MLRFRFDMPQIDGQIPDDAHLVDVISSGHRDGGAAWTPCDVSRLHIHTFEMAVNIAELATAWAEARGLRTTYLAADNGPKVSPRYDVIEAYKVGDLVSYSFNGDSYPDGEITRVGTGPRMAITTSTGSRYHRAGLTGRWRKEGGTRSLCHGHIDERNPHL